MRSLIYLVAAVMVVLLVAAILFDGSRALTIGIAFATWAAVQPVILLEIKRAQPVVRASAPQGDTGVYAMAH